MGRWEAQQSRGGVLGINSYWCLRDARRKMLADGFRPAMAEDGPGVHEAWGQDLGPQSFSGVRGWRLREGLREGEWCHRSQAGVSRGVSCRKGW